MKFTLITIFLFYFGFYKVSTSRVYELSDKFIEISEEGMWFVKFYAPWCAHCKRMEPIWAHVAQTLSSSPINVGKADCTRFSALASHYKVKAYPTIMFLKGPYHYVYNGERVKDDMVEYAMRMAQPAVQIVSHGDNLGFLKEAHNLFFGYIGNQQGSLWDMFTRHAEKYQGHSWFYALTQETASKELQPPSDSAIFVYKDNEIYYFKTHPELLEDREALNTTLNKWVNSERFGFFPKITASNIHEIMETEKYIVIVVVAENKLNEISQAERDFKDMVESIIRDKRNELHHRFQFGWTGNMDLANSIAMSELTVPHLIVLNSTTNHHHIPDDDPVLMTPEAVTMFLDQIHNQMVPTYGGNSWAVRVYRTVFEARSMLASMWRGNPVLTALVFGLPLGFLSLIFYSICCADILDVDDEDEEEDHEKKD